MRRNSWYATVATRIQRLYPQLVAWFFPQEKKYAILESCFLASRRLFFGVDSRLCQDVCDVLSCYYYHRVPVFSDLFVRLFTHVRRDYKDAELAVP